MNPAGQGCGVRQTQTGLRGACFDSLMCKCLFRLLNICSFRKKIQSIITKSSYRTFLSLLKYCMIYLANPQYDIPFLYITNKTPSNDPLINIFGQITLISHFKWFHLFALPFTFGRAYSFFSSYFIQEETPFIHYAILNSVYCFVVDTIQYYGNKVKFLLRELFLSTSNIYNCIHTQRISVTIM